MKNTGKQCNDEFITDIIRLIQEDKRPVSSIVKDFGVSEQTIRNWLKSCKESKDPDKVRISELEAELMETKRKLVDSELTIDILKKLRPSSPRTTGNDLSDNREGKQLRLPG